MATISGCWQRSSSKTPSEAFGVLCLRGRFAFAPSGNSRFFEFNAVGARFRGISLSMGGNTNSLQLQGSRYRKIDSESCVCVSQYSFSASLHASSCVVQALCVSHYDSGMYLILMMYRHSSGTVLALDLHDAIMLS